MLSDQLNKPFWLKFRVPSNIIWVTFYYAQLTESLGLCLMITEFTYHIFHNDLRNKLGDKTKIFY